MPQKKENLRIAMLGHKRIPSREGGVEIVVGELATRMVAMGHSVTCYNRRGHHVAGSEFNAKKQTEYQGVRLKSVLTIQKRGLAAMSASFFAAVRAAFGKYDVVHFHAEGPCAMLWLPKLFGKRCIATIHGLDHQRAKWGRFASWYLRMGEKVAARFADEIIVLSENVQNYFMETYGRKTVYIPNGVSPAEPVEAKLITEQYGLEKDGYILFLSRLVPEKGLKILVEAFKDVKTDKRLVIAGGASDSKDFEKELKELAAEDKRILFTGFVQGRLLEELYSNAYLYVLPSDLEGMPLSLLEAMSYGNCCLTSDLPECASVVGEAGVHFPKGDAEALKDALQTLCDHPDEVARKKQQMKEFFADSPYHWDTVVEKTVRLYGISCDPAASADQKEKTV